MKRIVMIDDEPGAVRYYRQALESRGYVVEMLDSADKARRWVTEPCLHPTAAMVLDLMMPPGKVFTAQETHNGLGTGLCLLHLIQKKYPSVPVLILSSFHEEIVEMQKNSPNNAMLRVASKYEAPPFSLVKILDEMTLDGKDPVSATCTATIENRYPEGVELRFPHPQSGWVRAIVAPTDLPADAEEGDKVDVRLFEESNDSVRCEVIAGTLKGGGRARRRKLEAMMPTLPEDESDPVAMARYLDEVRRAIGQG